MAGYVKIDRKILKWEWYKNGNVFRVFVHLILTANHNDAKWQGINIKRGQVVIGRIELASSLGLSEQKTRTAIDKLKLTKEITIKSTNKYSIITICKYESYQYFTTQQQPAIQPAVQPAIQPTNNQQITTNNKNNKDNKIFINKAVAENFNGLPEIKVGATVQLFKITKQTDVSTKDVEGLWEIFKIQNLTGEKFYENKDAVYSHFINWSKTQNFLKDEKGKRYNSNKDTSSSIGRTIKFDKP